MDSSLFTNTSLITELNILNGSLPRDYCALPQDSVIYVFHLITPQNLAACRILNTEFLDANTQALLALMEVLDLHQGKRTRLEACSLPLTGNHVAFSLVDKIKMHCYLRGTIQVLHALL